ncbi:hypothetical protein cypCar_00009946 [Cyprinus carpio]|nr:hypothetical protein cypCar_00009946 [Cyprinus carpio]
MSVALPVQATFLDSSPEHTLWVWTREFGRAAFVEAGLGRTEEFLEKLLVENCRKRTSPSLLGIVSFT